MHFSKAETHVGNSLVSYLDAAGKIWFGSIEKIKVTPQGSVSFAIRHQERLPDGKKDPFKEFAHFPARTYSSKMAETLVDVSPSQVLGHYARFKFSGGRAVVLDLRRLAKVNRWTGTVCCADAAAFRRFQTKSLTRVLTLACEWHSNPLSLPKSQSLGEGSNRLPTAD
ncbi:hypothetical protein B0H11DRAFT_2263676 [Mycena galericulata]|nr:hypothetical protein B0H11DRAFT_2263676 [Mycena galericulata]